MTARCLALPRALRDLPMAGGVATGDPGDGELSGREQLRGTDTRSAALTACVLGGLTEDVGWCPFYRSEVGS